MNWSDESKIENFNYANSRSEYGILLWRALKKFESLINRIEVQDKLRIDFLSNKNDDTRMFARINEEVFYNKKT